MPAQFAVVIRAFEAARPLKAGEVVDVSDWTHARSLTERRFIRPATEAEVNAATAPPPVKRGKESL